MHQLPSSHVTHFGGNAFDGAHAGAFYWRVRLSSGAACRAVGARLNPHTYRDGASSSPLGEIACHNSGKGLWHNEMKPDILKKVAYSKAAIKEMQNARKL